jgi:hypothetical protein
MKRGDCGSSGSLAATQSAVNAFSGSKPRQPPNPTHDGGFIAPRCSLARRISIGQTHWPSDDLSG